MDWISVKDGLPKTYGWVLGFNAKNGSFGVVYFKNGQFLDYDRKSELCTSEKITHWIEVPDFPKIDSCFYCRVASRCEYNSLPPDLRGESCQYYSLAERFGADDK